MRTLLIEPTAAADSMADRLRDAGHHVERCHEPGAPSSPCAGITGKGCPLDAGTLIEVAVAAGDRDPGDGAATCAVRTGMPLVLVGAGQDDPLAPWAETCDSADEVAGASRRAIEASAEKRALPLQREVERLLALEAIDAGAIEVTVRRRGDVAEVMVRTDRALDRSTVGVIATRVAAVDAQGSWPTTKLSVAVVAAP
jgi:hypothetical protein